MYGSELIIDLSKADVSKFNRKDLDTFLDKLCIDVLDVEVCDRHYWDDVGVPPKKQQTDPKTKGTTVIQFLLFSNVTVHTLDLLGTVYINIFVCREFDIQRSIDFCEEFFNANIENVTVINRI